jgi:hypothetical protein
VIVAGSVLMSGLLQIDYARNAHEDCKSVAYFSSKACFPFAIQVCPLEVTRYQLNEAVAAHKVSESRHFRGKLVFQVR